MSAQRCPNCRAEQKSPEGACRHCGWLPLQSSEMLFLDGQTVHCSNCRRPRPATDTACPVCGHELSLAAIRKNAAWTFNTITLFLLTTAVAVCLLLLRWSPFLGLLVAGTLSLSGFRTALLVGERKRYGYPVSAHDILRLLAGSLVGLLLGTIILGASGLMVAGVVNAIVRHLDRSAVAVTQSILFFLFASVGWVVMLSLNWRKPAWRSKFVCGAVTSSGLTVAIVSARSMLGANLVSFGLAMSILATILIGLTWTYRRGGAGPAKAFLVGAAAGYCLIAILGLAVWHDAVGIYRAFGLVATSQFLWPVVLTIGVLENVWSWEDAFAAMRPPGWIEPRGKNVTHSTRTIAAGAVLPDEIVFADEAESPRQSNL